MKPQDAIKVAIKRFHADNLKDSDDVVDGLKKLNDRHNNLESALKEAIRFIDFNTVPDQINEKINSAFKI